MSTCDTTPGGSAFELQCVECSTAVPVAGTAACARCGGTLHEYRYDYDHVAQRWADDLPDLDAGLWRYMDLLPVHDPRHIVTIGEGMTPLVRADRLGEILGCANLWIKDETRNPTRSLKDRQATVCVSVLRELGVTEAVTASTGNAGIACAAYAARAGIRLRVFMPDTVSAGKIALVREHGGEVVEVHDTYDRAKVLAADFAADRGMYVDKGVRNPAAVESMKTIAFEIAEQLAAPSTPNGRRGVLQAPDWYIQAVSGGLGPIGVIKGFVELKRMGLVDRIPKIGVVQAAGCSPMVTAYQSGAEAAEAIAVPATTITSLATGDPGEVYPLLRKHLLEFGGEMESVSDSEVFRMQGLLCETEELQVEAAAAAAFAGFGKLARSGKIATDEVVVVNASGNVCPL